jgi:hypothetical protein
MLRHTTDKLAQTTYAKATGEEIGALAEAQIRSVPSVPFLYAPTAETVSYWDEQGEENAENAAPPAVIETATNGLGIRPLRARSEGNKAAWRRRKVAADVSELYAEDPPPKQAFPLAAARAALTDLALRAGIAVTP